MLVAISDLHLSDCSTATNPHATSIQLLMKELEANIDAKEPTEICFLLNGDIFDLVRTSWWHENEVPADERPWGGKLDPATGMNPIRAVEKQFQAVLAKVLAQTSSKALIDGIKGLRDKNGKRATVRYTIGNHDRVLNNFPSLQQQIAAAFKPVEVTFANLHHAPDYGVFARHGHQWETACHGWEFLTQVLDKQSRAQRFDEASHRVMAIGEVITAELMSGFVWNVQQALPGDEHKAFRAMVAEVNNLRPQLDVIAWFTWVMERDVSMDYLSCAKEAFEKALKDTLATTLAKQWDRLKADFIVAGDITDYLDKALKILKGKHGLERLQELIPVLEKVEKVVTFVRGDREDDFYLGAAGELNGDELPPGVQYLLYGHTHTARQACISAERDGRVRMYVNTGTFLPLIERADDRKTFFRSNRMTFICFYRKDEDTHDRRGDGPTMDVWDGMKRKDYI